MLNSAPYNFERSVKSQGAAYKPKTQCTHKSNQILNKQTLLEKSSQGKSYINIYNKKS